MSAKEDNGHKARINEEIRARNVRLIDENKEQVGIVSLSDAIKRAKDLDLQLVEVSPNAEPPVCRIMDHQKYLFEQKKKRKKPKQTHLKIIQLRPVTDEGDYQVKLRNLLRFLEHGDKVKVVIRFRGREIAHNELGMRLMNRIREDIAEEATIEQMPKMEGKQIIMMVSPKRKTN